MMAPHGSQALVALVTDGSQLRHCAVDQAQDPISATTRGQIQCRWFLSDGNRQTRNSGIAKRQAQRPRNLVLSRTRLSTKARRIIPASRWEKSATIVRGIVTPNVEVVSASGKPHTIGPLTGVPYSSQKSGAPGRVPLGSAPLLRLPVRDRIDPSANARLPPDPRQEQNHVPRRRQWHPPSWSRRTEFSTPYFCTLAARDFLLYQVPPFRNAAEARELTNLIIRYIYRVLRQTRVNSY